MSRDPRAAGRPDTRAGLRVVILASGSEGNAALFISGETRVLIDAGIGPRALLTRLRAAGETRGPDAIVITHAHADHVGRARDRVKKLHVPVWATPSTQRSGALDGLGARTYSPREPFAIGALTLSPLPVPHDAAQVALVVSDGRSSAALVTDLGEVPPALPDHLARCELLLLESNHDPELLARGPYPAFLQRRIASARGHLSNGQAAELLRALPPRAHTVALLHLSRTNNAPELALAHAASALRGRGARLFAASQRETLVLEAAGPRGEQLGLF